MKQWKDQELLQELHRFYREYGRVPTTRELVNPWPNASTYTNRFGSVREALIEAGLPTHDVVERPYKYTDNELLKYIHKAADRLGRVPVYTDFLKKNAFHAFPHVKTFENRFGTFQNAIDLSGVLDKDFSQKVEETIQRGVEIMDAQLKPGAYKNVTNGFIFCEVEGEAATIKPNIVVRLNQSDLAKIVTSDIIKKGLLLPTEETVTVDNAFIRNYYSDEMMEDVIKRVEGADELEAILAEIDSIVTVNRFLNVLQLLDSPNSYVVACETRMEALRMAELPQDEVPE